ncbi:MAG: VWA domain-containing protein [Lachnospiraceae bacterium]|nr:VWA domain-containing protein [Lachnospiraceae bacterium]
MSGIKEEMQSIREKTLHSKTWYLIAICVDASMSMEGRKIESVNQELMWFLNKINNDSFNRDSFEIAIITFGDSVRTIYGFSRIERMNMKDLNIEADGLESEMGKGISTMLEMIDEETRKIKELGHSYYKPWLFIIGDGGASDHHSCAKISREVIERQKSGRLKVDCFSCEDQQEDSSLKLFTLDGSVKDLKELGNKEFDEEFSRASSSVSVAAIENGES